MYLCGLDAATVLCSMLLIDEGSQMPIWSGKGLVDALAVELSDEFENVLVSDAGTLVRSNTTTVSQIVSTPLSLCLSYTIGETTRTVVRGRPGLNV